LVKIAAVFSVGDAENARHGNAGLENAAQTCRLLQGVENARLEHVAQKYRAGKCRKRKCGTKPLRVENARMEKAGKEKIWKAVCKIIIWHYAYRMHGLNNAAKDASLSVYFQSGVNLDHITVRSQTSMMMTTRRRRSASTVAMTSHQRMLNLKICVKSA